VGSVAYFTSIINDSDPQILSLEAEVARLASETDRLNATVQSLNVDIAQKNNEINNLNYEINSLNSQIAELNSQIDDLNNQVANQPKLVLDSYTVEDDRSSVPYNLHIICRVNNTGGSTAYNALLHVTAFNAEGLAISDYYDFTGITAKMTAGFDFRMNYTGSAITAWSITPIWTDGLVESYRSSPFSP